MKHTILIILTLLIPTVILFSQSEENESPAVKDVIIKGYIQGVFLKGDVKLIEKYWHETCDIVYFEPKSRTLLKGSAVKHFEGVFEKKPGPFDEKITYEFKNIQIVGYAAVAAVAIYNHDRSKQIYTDFLSLYKFDDGWKIVSKTFYAFPKE